MAAAQEYVPVVSLLHDWDVQIGTKVLFRSGICCVFQEKFKIQHSKSYYTSVPRRLGPTWRLSLKLQAAASSCFSLVLSNDFCIHGQAAMALSGPAGTDSFLERDWRVPPEMLFSCRGFRGGGAKGAFVNPCFFQWGKLLRWLLNHFLQCLSFSPNFFLNHLFCGFLRGLL